MRKDKLLHTRNGLTVGFMSILDKNDKTWRCEATSLRPTNSMGLQMIPQPLNLPTDINDDIIKIDEDDIIDDIKPNDSYDIAGDIIDKSGYKIDWISVTLPFDYKEEGIFKLYEYMQRLGYRYDEFTAVDGKNFYNECYTLDRYVNFYINNHNKTLKQGYSDTLNIVFTGIGCIDYYTRTAVDDKLLDSKLIVESMFNKLLELPEARFRRLDLAFDDFDGVLDLNVISDKLDAKEFKSKKRTYQVIKEKTVDGAQELGHTIYIGSRSSKTYMLRAYSKKLQYMKKREKLPDVAIRTGIWNRYEFEFKGDTAHQIVNSYITKESPYYLDEDKIFKSMMTNCITFLEPKDSHKRYWKPCDWWIEYLNNSAVYKFETHERNPNFQNILAWFSSSIMNSLKALEIILEHHGYDVYDLLRDYKMPSEFSKKLNKAVTDGKALDEDKVNNIIRDFMAGKLSREYNKQTAEGGEENGENI